MQEGGPIGPNFANFVVRRTHFHIRAYPALIVKNKKRSIGRFCCRTLGLPNDEGTSSQNHVPGGKKALPPSTVSVSVLSPDNENERTFFDIKNDSSGESNKLRINVLFPGTPPPV